MRLTKRWWGRPVVAGLALVAGGCYDFHLEGPEDAPAVSAVRYVDVSIEYRQPNGCENSLGRCSDNVVFFGSWMRPGGEFFLKPDPNTHVWTGKAVGVPVNFPPADQPYLVRIYDPHLFDAPTLGFTAERLRIGGQVITRFDRPGGPSESGLVFVDDNGVGRNPF